MLNHSMRKYNKIDCVIINETEIRHELKKNEKIGDLMKQLSKERIKNLIVTQGRKGSILLIKLIII